MKKGARGWAPRSDFENRFCNDSNITSPRASQVTSSNLILGNLRVLWWNQCREGVRLPAEVGVILIDGGRR